MYKNFLETGQVVGTHAIHGEIRVQPWCDAPEFLKNFKEFYLDENGESSITALEIRPHGNIVIMK
ncbi:MAG: 16S rRNA processing protein RimM, partial [Oscillospiraceae bacterium]